VTYGFLPTTQGYSKEVSLTQQQQKKEYRHQLAARGVQYGRVKSATIEKSNVHLAKVPFFFLERFFLGICN